MLNKVLLWQGRIQLMNSLAYFFLKQKDYTNALKFTIEAQLLIQA